MQSFVLIGIDEAMLNAILRVLDCTCTLEHYQVQYGCAECGCMHVTAPSVTTVHATTVQSTGNWNSLIQYMLKLDDRIRMTNDQ
jgi:hypothetical protein